RAGRFLTAFPGVPRSLHPRLFYFVPLGRAAAFPLLWLLLVITAPAFAQSEAVLQQAFEGKSVIVKIDMPATHQGIDLYPNRDRLMDFDSYQRRLKQFGAALRAGDPVLITRIRVKDKNIEFQLGGGGYGTAGDDTDTSVSAVTVPKSRYEKDLEERIKRETDPRRKRELQNDLNHERRQRERENERNRIAAEEASEIKKERIARKRLEGGSRFNIWYEPRVPIANINPANIKELLAEYLEFGGRSEPPPLQVNNDAILRLRKGMSRTDVLALFGPPQRTTEKGSGDTKTLVLFYQIGERDVQAEFVSDVLVRYVISSR
ncbi:MAG TPA: hypothetical protein VFZ34_26375, partial [Blastocatellia bacterium]|nr:hypothetical protein [Blastocatellia bacterium]